MVKCAGLKIRPVQNDRSVILVIFVNEMVRFGNFYRGELCRIEDPSGSKGSLRDSRDLCERVGSYRKFSPW